MGLSPHHGWRSVAVAYGLLCALWLLPPTLLWLPTLAAQGKSSFDLFWPAQGLGHLLSGRACLDRCRGTGWDPTANPTSFGAVLGAEIAVIALVGAMALRECSRRPRVPVDSRWARRWDLRRSGLLARRPQPGRLAVGRWGHHLIAADPGVSLLVFGPTGSGKTAGICIPQVVEWDGPAVALSVKNDLVIQAAGARQARGRTEVYDPTNLTGLATCSWSPLQRCESWDRAMRVGQWLVQGKRGYTSDNAEWEHWEDAAMRLVACALYAGATLNRPVTDALAWLDDGSGQRLGRALAAIANRDPRALQWYHSVQERPERERGSCYSTSQRALRPYMERAIGASAQESTFDPRKFLTRGSDTLFIVAPQSEQERLSGVFTSLIMTIMIEAADLAQAEPSGRLPRPLLVMLDECANTAPLRELPQYLSTVRGMGITLVAIFQDLAQCEARYQDLAGNVVNNAQALLFLGGARDLKTLGLLRDLAGRQRRPRHTLDNRGGHQVSVEMEELLSLDIGRQLLPGRGVLFYRHLPPIMLGVRNCHRDTDLVGRRQPFYPGVIEMTSHPWPRIG